jgi:tRNA G18 (ribose-2'-O)-methylase SpoU
MIMNNTESINEKIIQNMIEITDFDAPELDVYARLTEAQLLNKDHPEDGLFIAESPKVISRALDGGYEPVSVLVEKRQVLEDAETIAVLGKCGNVPVYTAEFEVLTKLTGFKLTRGMLCAMKRRRLPGLQEICNGCDRIAVLENVMNPTNVGAIFRSAAALHMDAVILTGGCSNPLYRRASRVSMGTVFQIPWTFVDNSVIWPEEGMKILRELGFKMAAMALKEDSASIDDPELMKEDKLAVILGTEGDGLAPETIADCDYTVMIPMSHGVDSLNVAAASAVAFWQLGKR